MHTVNIADKVIGEGHPCFIIAEAGVNHNGDLALAKQLIDAAKRVGADAVKFQTWITEKLVTPDAPMAEYQRKNIGKEQSQFEMLKPLELSQDQFRQLKDYADSQNILFFSTPDETESADFLEGLGIPVFKIGSAEVTDLPFLRHVALKRKPMILSTGMSTLGEVEAAVRTIEETGNRELALLHCVSDYPANPADCNLRAMDTLIFAFQHPVGFSDHTLAIEIAVAAVARGACVIEKHLTLDKSMPGPDHRASLDPAEFTAMVKAIRMVEQALGTNRKTPTANELLHKALTTKRLYARDEIHAGDTLEEWLVELRRGNDGIPASRLQDVEGLVLRRTISSGHPILWDDLIGSGRSLH